MCDTNDIHVLCECFTLSYTHTLTLSHCHNHMSHTSNHPPHPIKQMHRALCSYLSCSLLHMYCRSTKNQLKLLLSHLPHHWLQCQCCLLTFLFLFYACAHARVVKLIILPKTHVFVNTKHYKSLALNYNVTNTEHQFVILQVSTSIQISVG